MERTSKQVTEMIEQVQVALESASSEDVHAALDREGLDEGDLGEVVDELTQWALETGITGQGAVEQWLAGEIPEPEGESDPTVGSHPDYPNR